MTLAGAAENSHEKGQSRPRSAGASCCCIMVPPAGCKLKIQLNIFRPPSHASRNSAVGAQWVLTFTVCITVKEPRVSLELDTLQGCHLHPSSGSLSDALTTKEWGEAERELLENSRALPSGVLPVDVRPRAAAFLPPRSGREDEAGASSCSRSYMTPSSYCLWTCR